MSDERPAEGLGWLFFSLRGRLPLGRFWRAMGGLALTLVIAMLLASSAGYGLDTRFIADLDPTGQGFSFGGNADGPLLLLVWVASSLLQLPLLVKRLHDRDRSGSWLFIMAIPLVGWFWISVELFLVPGTTGPNRFGPDPRRS